MFVCLFVCLFIVCVCLSQILETKKEYNQQLFDLRDRKIKIVEKVTIVEVAVAAATAAIVATVVVVVVVVSSSIVILTFPALLYLW